MYYTMVDKQTAEAAGFSELSHRVVGGRMILNEKEIMFADIPGGTVDGKIARLGGRKMTGREVMNTINQKGGNE